MNLNWVYRVVAVRAWFPPLLYFALPAVTRATAHRTKHFHGHSMPGLLLGDVFPDFEAETTTGTIKLHEFLGDS